MIRLSTSLRLGLEESDALECVCLPRKSALHFRAFERTVSDELEIQPLTCVQIGWHVSHVVVVLH
jgi:hypothetical protein